MPDQPIRRDDCPGDHTHEWVTDYDYEHNMAVEFCLLEPLVCPKCGAVEPETEDGKTSGFTGALIYWTNFLCCGHQEFDASGDNLAAAE